MEPGDIPTPTLPKCAQPKLNKRLGLLAAFRNQYGGVTASCKQQQLATHDASTAAVLYHLQWQIDLISVPHQVALDQRDQFLGKERVFEQVGPFARRLMNGGVADDPKKE